MSIIPFSCIIGQLSQIPLVVLMFFNHSIAEIKMASLKKLDLTNDSKRNEVLLKDRVKEVNESTCIDQILTMY